MGNHLGNVLEVVTDRKLQIETTIGSGVLDYYSADVVSQSDYFPFGMMLPNRNETQGDGYRYGFQGQEMDDEVRNSPGTSVNYSLRMHDARIGRFFTIDPVASEYPELTPYQFSSNRVIDGVEFEGLEVFPIHGTWGTNEWGKTELSNEIAHLFGNESVNVLRDPGLDKKDGSQRGWTGNNKKTYRKKAAKKYAAYIKANHKAGEPITILGHSHGGNVGILTMNILAGDPDLEDVELNLVTMNTPVRENQLNEEANEKVNHYQIYNKFDVVQASGGDQVTIGEGEKLGKGEYGKAGRKFKSAVNIEYKPAKFGPNGWHQGWDPANIERWFPLLENAVNSSKPSTSVSSETDIDSGLPGALGSEGESK